MAFHSQLFFGCLIAVSVILGTDCIAIGDPSIDFSGDPADVNENGGPVTITLMATSAVSQDVTIDISAMTTTNQAVPGFDYSGSGTYTATIPSGQTTGSFDLTITDDSFTEPNEVVLLAIDSVSAGGTAGSTTQTVSFTILADGSDTDMVRVNFRSDTYEQNESGGLLLIDVDYTDLNGEPTVLNEEFTLTLTAPSTLTTDTATFNDDFVDPAVYPVDVPTDSMATSDIAPVFLFNDLLVEGTESFSIGMMADSALSYTVLGNFISEAVVLLRDNDLENLICVSMMPEVPPFTSADFVFYAFTSLASDASSIAWSNRRFGRPLSSSTTVGSNGIALTVSRPRKGKFRRFGYYSFTATGTSGASLACTTFVRPRNNVFNQPSSFDHKFTKVIYPTADGSTDITPAITITVQYKTPRRRNRIRWAKDGVLLPRQTRAAITVDNTGQAGVYIVSRYIRRRREFAIFELIASDCPENQYRDTTCMACKTCYNGGVCNHDGRCICPPCFEGAKCEFVVDDLDGFGDGTRFSCSADLGVSSLCRGALFTLEGLYGTSCGCGWKGQGCRTECTRGTFGADCTQTCHCATRSACDTITGRCMDGRGCESGYSGDNCQVPVEVSMAE